MSYKFEYSRKELELMLDMKDDIPSTIKEAIKNYLFNHDSPGSGLVAILSNDLFETYSKCDDETLKSLHAIIKFFHNMTPGKCQGSKENVEIWLSGRGDYPTNW